MQAGPACFLELRGSQRGGECLQDRFALVLVECRLDRKSVIPARKIVTPLRNNGSVSGWVCTAT
jgi:hypothetical protein